MRSRISGGIGSRGSSIGRSFSQSRSIPRSSTSRGGSRLGSSSRSILRGNTLGSIGSRNSRGSSGFSLGQRQINRSGSTFNRGGSSSRGSGLNRGGLLGRGGISSRGNIGRGTLGSIRSNLGRSVANTYRGSRSQFSSSRGGRNWSGRFNNRHGYWHRGFGVGAFRSRPWGFSPWYGGWGNRGGIGFGLTVGNWGWNDWWGPWGYAPLAYQTGYYDYYNPYCEQPITYGSTVIDYSQPIIVNDNASLANSNTSDDPNVTAAMGHFDTARAAFARGDYSAAEQSAQKALELLPSDAALHEFMALVQFAQGDYQQAAGTMHSVLAVGPGWSWDTLRGLYGYGNVSTYTQHLRAAEAYRNANPDQAGIRLLLAYHYMTTNYSDAAAGQLRKVIAIEPQDTVAAKLLEGLTGEKSPEAAAKPMDEAPAAPELPQPAPPVAGEKKEAPKPGALVGTWSAKRGDKESFGLTLTDDGQFTWKFTQEDRTSELKGKYSLKDDLLILEPAEGGAMIGRVNLAGEGFRFRLVGAPESDAGLVFGK